MADPGILGEFGQGLADIAGFAVALKQFKENLKAQKESQKLREQEFELERQKTFFDLIVPHYQEQAVMSGKTEAEVPASFLEFYGIQPITETVRVKKVKKGEEQKKAEPEETYEPVLQEMPVLDEKYHRARTYLQRNVEAAGMVFNAANTDKWIREQIKLDGRAYDDNSAKVVEWLAEVERRTELNRMATKEAELSNKKTDAGDVVIPPTPKSDRVRRLISMGYEPTASFRELGRTPDIYSRTGFFVGAGAGEGTGIPLTEQDLSVLAQGHPMTTMVAGPDYIATLATKFTDINEFMNHLDKVEDRFIEAKESLADVDLSDTAQVMAKADLGRIIDDAAKAFSQNPTLFDKFEGREKDAAYTTTRNQHVFENAVTSAWERLINPLPGQSGERYAYSMLAQLGPYAHIKGVVDGQVVTVDTFGVNSDFMTSALGLDLDSYPSQRDWFLNALGSLGYLVEGGVPEEETSTPDHLGGL